VVVVHVGDDLRRSPRADRPRRHGTRPGHPTITPKPRVVDVAYLELEEREIGVVDPVACRRVPGEVVPRSSADGVSILRALPRSVARGAPSGSSRCRSARRAGSPGSATRFCVWIAMLLISRRAEPSAVSAYGMTEANGQPGAPRLRCQRRDALAGEQGAHSLRVEGSGTWDDGRKTRAGSWGALYRGPLHAVAPPDTIADAQDTSASLALLTAHAASGEGRDAIRSRSRNAPRSRRSTGTRGDDGALRRGVAIRRVRAPRDPLVEALADWAESKGFRVTRVVRDADRVRRRVRSREAVIESWRVRRAARHLPEGSADEGTLEAGAPVTAAATISSVSAPSARRSPSKPDRRRKVAGNRPLFAHPRGGGRRQIYMLRDGSSATSTSCSRASERRDAVGTKSSQALVDLIVEFHGRSRMPRTTAWNGQSARTGSRSSRSAST